MFALVPGWVIILENALNYKLYVSSIHSAYVLFTAPDIIYGISFAGFGKSKAVTFEICFVMCVCVCVCVCVVCVLCVVCCVCFHLAILELF